MTPQTPTETPTPPARPTPPRAASGCPGSPRRIAQAHPSGFHAPASSTDRKPIDLFEHPLVRRPITSRRPQPLLEGLDRKQLRKGVEPTVSRRSPRRRRIFPLVAVAPEEIFLALEFIEENGRR